MLIEQDPSIQNSSTHISNEIFDEDLYLLYKANNQLVIYDEFDKKKKRKNKSEIVDIILFLIKVTLKE